MFDTHCHLAFAAFAGRVERILSDAEAAGVCGAITVSTTSRDCLEGLELARGDVRVWCTAGVHPLSANQPRDWSNIKAVAQDDRCVAWGELGLDHHYDDPPASRQRELLGEQLAFIESCSGPGGVGAMPIVVHCRDAVDDLLGVFGEAGFEPQRYVFHCFTGTPQEARKVLDFGAWISFTGVVTFKNAREVAEAAKIVPADRIMVETDAPYLSPEPVRKMHPNEPRNVVHIARFLAALRGVDATEFEAQLDRNAERCFGVDAGSARGR